MRISLITVQSEAEATAATRSCGECTACCVLPRIRPEEEPDVFPQGKGGYTPCQHLSTQGCGCSIYANRPNLCQDYDCLWRAGMIPGDNRRRPDNLGLMFVFDVFPGEILVVEAWELWQRAALEYPGRGVIEALGSKYRLAIRFYGVPCSIIYDASREAEFLEYGFKLSELARCDPPLLAKWLARRIEAKDLADPNQAFVLHDLAALCRGEAVQAHYQPK